MLSFASSTALIDLNALHFNAKLLKSAALKSSLAAVVKADAYGHGAIPIAQSLADLVTFFCVARVDEAIELRNAGIQQDILVFTPSTLETAPIYIEHNLIATVSNFRAFDRLPDGTRVHLNMDTGMGRLGFMHNQIAELKAAIERHQSRLKIEGMYSHFSDAESPSRALTKEQVRQFEHIVEQFSSYGLKFHQANSAAISQIPSSHYNAVRAGISLYGYSDGFQFNNNLKPVMQWKSTIVECRKIREGWPISYGATWQAKEEGYVGVVPVGYADGLNRGLSNQIYFSDSKTGQKFKQIGRITMDHTMVWLGDEPLEEGTEIDLMNGYAMSTIEWAHILKTIPYEIVCNIGKRVKRIYYTKKEAI